jgi:metal-responsive CopG/Arc/MetJ family transcriptional regulator
MPATMGNITVSIPKRLIAVVEEIVKENKTNRSKVISQCLEELARKRNIELMEEGYREMAEENRLLAEQFLPIALETWPK